MKITLEEDFDVICNGCGTPLEAVERNGTISVDTCYTCIETKESEARDEGYEEGLADGKAAQ